MRKGCDLLDEGTLDFSLVFWIHVHRHQGLRETFMMEEKIIKIQNQNMTYSDQVENAFKILDQTKMT